MTGPPLLDRVKRNASGIAATTVTGIWLAALMLGFDWWLAFMLFGYIVIVPVVSMLFDDEDWSEWAEWLEKRRAIGEGPSEPDGTGDALDRLRTRYAEGELTDEQFERKLDRLLETESVEDAAEWRARELERESDRRNS